MSEKNICQKYFIPDGIKNEEEAIEWAKNQATLDFEDGGWEFIHEQQLIELLSRLYEGTQQKKQKIRAANP